MKRILGILGWLGVVLVVAAVILRFTKPELQQVYQGLALAGLVVTLLYAASQWRDIGRSFQGRNVKYGSVAAGSVLVFVGILVAVNWISSRQNKRWDLTESKQFSLSEQTKQILSGLKSPLVVRVFYGSQDSAQRYRDRFQEYAVPLQADLGGVHQRGEPADRGGEIRSLGRPDHRHGLRGPDAARDQRRRVGRDEYAEEAARRQGQEGLLPAGPRRARYGRRDERARVQERGGRAGRRQLRGRQAHARAAGRDSGRRDRAHRRRRHDGPAGAGNRAHHELPEGRRQAAAA